MNDHNADSGDSGSSEDDGGSDPESNSSDNESDQDDRAPIQRLSNELLTNIICNMDAPRAVCLALTCRKFYALVTVVCERDLWDICPIFYKTDQERGISGTPPMLQPYQADIWETQHQLYSITACKTLLRMGWMMTPKRWERMVKRLSNAVLTLEYTALSKLMPWLSFQYLFGCSCGYAHFRVGLGCSSEDCLICTQMSFLEAGHPFGESAENYLRRVEASCHLE